MNLTGSEVRGEEYLTYRVFFEYFVLFFSPLIIVCNAIVILSACLLVRARTDPNIVYTCQLITATADFSICLAVIFEILEINNTYQKYICAFKLGSVTSCSLTSMLSICLIAIERFLYIVHGWRYDTYLTPTRTGVLIASVWIIGLSFGLVPSLVEAQKMECEYVEVCEFIKSPTSVIVTAAVLAIPALIFTPLAYTALYCHVRKVAAKMSNEIPSIKFKSIVMVFLSSISFLLCWGPFIICCAIYKFYCEPRGLACRKVELAVVSPLACLGFFNSLLNPMIYAWWHPPYNSALRKVLCSDRTRRAKQRASLYEPPSREQFIATIT